ncbi:MAG TPA: DTW domain-containing protein [Cellvibrionaceae bacterium]
MLNHSYHSLRQHRLDRATKPFNARGARLIRCEHCLLAQNHCICSYCSPMESCVDWVVLMHEDEVLKPTNTGRLLADVFPSTLVFEWARLHPPEGLAHVLSDPQRLIVLVFPSDEAYTPVHAQHRAQLGNRRLTLILLDGTWKQARKMFNRTPWLKDIPTVAVPTQSTQYALRKAAHDGCLSTAEAAIGVLDTLDPGSAYALLTFFNQFNQAYVLSRGMRELDVGMRRPNSPGLTA